jgi:hypothetical protein
MENEQMSGTCEIVIKKYSQQLSPREKRLINAENLRNLQNFLKDIHFMKDMLKQI